MSVLDKQDVVVVGAGVVGLAIARALASEGRKVLLVEREAAAGRIGSSRTSGVVHAGLHHPKDWLKSRLARRGRGMLYAFAKRHGVAFAKTGKWIVAATEDERVALESLSEKAKELHLTTRWLEADQARLEEPSVRVHAALQIEETGVIRSAELVQALVREFEALGGELLIGAAVERVEPGPDVALHLGSGVTLRASEVILAAGLATDGLLRDSGLNTDALGLTQYPCQGEWVALSERHRKHVSRHIYPLPQADGLGIHLTRDPDGYLYAGPDVTWQESPSYELDPRKVPAFGEALRRFYPSIADEDLHPMMAGIRPKLSRRGEPARDFVVWSGGEHGWPHVTALLGIESPGLTACLALGDHVAALLL